jgi:sigma-B regulation protein RsbU (phosphoserine phosphatase)
MTVHEQLIPHNETARLAAVRRYDVLDTPPDGCFERITSMAARQFRVPISIVSIVDTDRIWFKSHHGVDVDEIGRDPGLCASAILGDGPWVVENAETDPRTMANPLVAGELGLRFYAGAPLTTHDGYNLGTLCVIDQEPREFSATDAETLADLAAVVMDELELRLAAKRAVRHELHLRAQAEQMARALQTSLLPPELPTIPGAELAALYLPADAGVVGGDFYDVFPIEQGWALAVGDVSGKGPSAAAVTGLARHTIRAAALTATAPADVLRTLNRVMLLDAPDGGLDHFCTTLLIFARPHRDGFALTLAAGGHLPPMIVRADGQATQVKLIGAPAGCFPDAAFGEVAADLGPGDGLLLFTDGVTEARTSSGLLGTTVLQERLSDDRPRTAAELVTSLRSVISGPGVDVRDDVAALALSVD